MYNIYIAMGELAHKNTKETRAKVTRNSKRSKRHRN